MTRKQLIRLHVIFWSVTLFFICLQAVPAINKVSLSFIAVSVFLYTISVFSVFYIYYFYVQEKHLNKRNIIIYIIAGVVFLFVITVPVALINIYVYSKELFLAERKVFLAEGVKYYSVMLEGNLLFAVTGVLTRLAVLWYQRVMEQKEAEKKVFAEELALLKSQVNPRFFFSALNDIKGLILIKPETAIYSIEQFADILSYMLYETSADKVYLNDELNNIRNYINLQKIKYTPEAIQVNVLGETDGKKIPPSVFFPLIEIIFSYSNFTCKQSAIDIKFIITDNNILLKIISYVINNAEPESSEQELKLEAIRRQLFLQFGGSYSLNIKKENEQIFTELSIRLAA